MTQSELESAIRARVGSDLVDLLDQEAARRGDSLEATVIGLLRERLQPPARRSNGLRRFAGTWTEEEFQEFERAVAHFEEV